MGIKEQLAAQNRPLSKEEIFTLFTVNEEKFIKPSLVILNQINAYNLLVDLRDAVLTPEQKPVITKRISYDNNASYPKTLVHAIVDCGVGVLSPQDIARWNLFGMTKEIEDELALTLTKKYEFDEFASGYAPSEGCPQVTVSFELTWGENCDYRIEISESSDITSTSKARWGIVGTEDAGTYIRGYVCGGEKEILKRSENIAARRGFRGTVSDGVTEIRPLSEIERIIAMVYLQTVTPNKDGV